MRYDEIRDQIQSGDVIAFSRDGWGSWSDIESQIVRMATRSEYSHVAIAWPVAGRVMLLEAVVPKIRIYPLSKLLPFYWLPVKRPLSPEAEEYALSRVGEEYSKWEAIRGFFGRTRDNGKWQCAEYGESILAENGLPIPGVATPTRMVYGLMAMDIPLIMVTK